MNGLINLLIVLVVALLCCKERFLFAYGKEAFSLSHKDRINYCFMMRLAGEISDVGAQKCSSPSDSLFEDAGVGVLKFCRVIERPEDVVARLVLFEQGGAVFGAEDFP